MHLPGRQRRHLRGLAHHLDPVVHVGKGGVTESVINAVERALLDHELIKVKLPDLERTERAKVAGSIETATGAALVGVTGRVGIFYRAHPDKPVIQLPE